MNNLSDKIAALKDIINASDNIVFFSRGRIHREQPDFRSAGGLYSEKGKGRFTPEEMLSHFFRNHRRLFDYYKTRLVRREAKQQRHIAGRA